ncbi:CBS domain-containing protein [Streptomyces sp. TRM68367]|uniref:CBS domain-containing protein n=1 Tax=Streptomyces sp. TRM68367 TaxID=2758415 RepID=UPI00165B99D1|nr:CBS domain-containing protein [Streptomyces sp. TRM68367]MBC9727649.1 CBS domain-containing protein [Streptomyces sp. TRM68367]
MPARLFDRQDVFRLVEQEGAQLVEVLPPKPYEQAHLPGALRIGLRDLDEAAPGELDPRRPVIGYCADQLCDLSPRAAARLEQLGFRQVYDYVPGKADWLAAGLPREGEAARTPLAGDVADRNVPLCTVDQLLDDALAMLDETGRRTGVVVDDEDVVVGLLRHDDAADRTEGRVADILRPGPATVRADEELGPLLERMRKAGLPTVPVTDPEGHLLGVLDREDVERAIARREGAAQ